MKHAHNETHDESLARLMADLRAVPAVPVDPCLTAEELVAQALGQQAPNEPHLAACRSCAQILKNLMEGLPVPHQPGREGLAEGLRLREAELWSAVVSVLPQASRTANGEDWAVQVAAQLTAHDPSVRARSAAALGSLGAAAASDQILLQLLRGLHDPDERVRTSVTQALAALRTAVVGVRPAVPAVALVSEPATATVATPAAAAALPPVDELMQTAFQAAATAWREFASRVMPVWSAREEMRWVSPRQTEEVQAEEEPNGDIRFSFVSKDLRLRGCRVRLRAGSEYFEQELKLASATLVAARIIVPGQTFLTLTDIELLPVQARHANADPDQR